MNPRESGGGVEAMKTQTGGPELGEEGDKALAYDCGVCGRSFPFQSSLSQHMRRHTGARPYKCPYCNHRASQKGNLKVHIRSHKLGTLTSHHPEVEGDEEEGLEEVEAGSGEVGVSEGLDGGTSPTKSSSACNSVVDGAAASRDSGTGKAAVRGAKREKSIPELRPYRCRLCGYETQREDQLLSHIEKVHITADTEDEPPPETPRETGTTEGDAGSQETDGAFPCGTCGQAFTQAWFLKSHMKKHAGLLEHCCRVCGRRFREAWFLKSHMKTHSSSKSSSRAKHKADSQESPATINDVAQDPESSATSPNHFQLCSKCGNLFHDRESLRAHERVHSQSRQQQNQKRLSDDANSPPAKRRLLDYLSLRPAGVETRQEEVGFGMRIPELDPVCSHQAWQLATRGRVLEPIEAYGSKATAGGGEEESLVDGNVVYEKENSRYVLKGQERRSARRVSGGSHHTSPGERTPDSLSDSEYRPSSRQGRRSSSSQQSKSTECFECGKVFRSRHQMIGHQRVHQRRDGGQGSGSSGDNRAGRGGDRWGSTSDPDSGPPSRPSTPGYGDSPPASTVEEEAPEVAATNAGPLPDEKPYICSLCDFVSAESSAFLSHLRVQHTSDDRPAPSPSCEVPSGFPKLKKALLNGLPQTSAPHSYLSAWPPREKYPPESSSPSDPERAVPLDLCVRVAGLRGPASAAPQQKSLASHKCSYCSHTTRYPEVLWMHQAVAHRINSSTMAPKWALLRNGLKGPREGTSSKRRTGPPPSLDGKECPPLAPVMRTPRTRPPTWKKDSEDRAAGQPSTSSSSRASSSTSSLGPQSGRPPRSSGVRPRGKAEENRGQGSRANSRPRVEIYQRGGSSTCSLEKSTAAGAPKRSSAPSPAVGGTRYVLPQEGLGFMLASKHSLADYGQAKNSPPPKPRSPQFQPRLQPPAKSGVERSAHSTGTSAAQAHRVTPSQTSRGTGQESPMLSTTSLGHRNQVKQLEVRTAEATEVPMDIMSFLKNCNTQDLATLYHRWGATNPMLDPTGVLRSRVRHGEYICQECGASFSQSSHLRIHMRSHAAVFDYNEHGSDPQTAPSEAPTQGRDHSASACPKPLRKGT
ncbi:hypothetical protein DPEC_G00349240 [Dallia pectoralis]|uniref:Uncharacterized protein n=1 Tax=Dallia pectoralis TaxID=75939 RepID=A0ACC2F1G7_DALPE|nr:hypothetical protein DPEC_G00349240 [Dallia pectoralis]